MKIQRMDHVGIVVNDLAAAIAFFIDFGFEVLGEAKLQGEWVDKVIGLHGVSDTFAMLGTPDGGTNIELIQFYTPTDEKGLQQSSSNTLGIRHLSYAVDDLEAVVAELKKKGHELFSEIYNYENIYKLCYCRGPEGIILELSEKVN